MREELLLDVPHRQVVFVIPKMLRVFFKYNRRLLGDLCRAAVNALLKYLQVTTGTELRPGIVASIQTFGQKINLHVHLHFLVTEGGEDSEGRFHHLAEFQHSLLAEFFKQEVFSLLLLAEQILTYRRLHGLTQKKLSHLLGIDPTTIGHWERGEHWPQKPFLDKLISFFASFPSDLEKNEKME